MTGMEWSCAPYHAVLRSSSAVCSLQSIESSSRAEIVGGVAITSGSPEPQPRACCSESCPAFDSRVGLEDSLRCTVCCARRRAAERSTVHDESAMAWCATPIDEVRCRVTCRSLALDLPPDRSYHPIVLHLEAVGLAVRRVVAVDEFEDLHLTLCTEHGRHGTVPG